ncbi:DUF5326 family protein, partial [Streptomyces huasconensis]|uniref:DUF5326 family protein n=1 Tax=Streptomyces huasconensis TaxID=1854574 RepID=UPI003F4DC113
MDSAGRRWPSGCGGAAAEASGAPLTGLRWAVGFVVNLLFKALLFVALVGGLIYV